MIEAKKVQQHIRWNRDLANLVPVRSGPTQSFLTYQIDVLTDFRWFETMGRRKQTFRHYLSLSNYVREHQQRRGKPAVLLLTDQLDQPEGIDHTHADFDVLVVCVPRLRSLRNADVATAYFLGADTAGTRSGSFLSDVQLCNLLNSVSDRQALKDWMEAEAVGVGLSTLSQESGGALTDELRQRLGQMSTDQKGHLEELLADSDFPANLLEAALLTRRREAVAEFKTALEENTWTETDGWQPFFRKHRWIFGHGLLYQFLDPVADEIYVGGKTLENKMGQIGDSAVRTASGNASFLALVEIKTPGTRLLGKEYRRGRYPTHNDLAGPVAQLLHLCDCWNREGSQNPVNIRTAIEDGWETAQPRGILVVGDTSELDSSAKQRSFELFRRHLHGVEILTFDELYSRAAKLVELGTEQFDGDAPEYGPPTTR